MIKPFIHTLPPARLGTLHSSLESFYASIYNNEIDARGNDNPSQPEYPEKSRKEYTLIIITESCNERILLGLKNRGFGTGFYNSFGGKVDPSDSSVAYGAVRELKEETNISVSLDIMEKSFVGTLDFTFEDNDKQMIVHVFHIDVKCVSKEEYLKSLASTNFSDERKDMVIVLDPEEIKPPSDNEITPKWFNNWYEIPLFNMHADDSIWLHKVLSAVKENPGAKSRKLLNGWFHFAPGSTEVNTILHHHIEYV